MHSGIQDGGFCTFISKVLIYFPFNNELKCEPKYVETETLYSLFGGKQSSDGKEINTASESPARAKKHACSRTINTNG